MKTMRMIAGWIVSYLMRWLPHAAETGLFPIGEPESNSPVIVTANFSLTVRRVRKALQGQDVWLLVANTRGINVWCAADGAIFTEQSVIDAIVVSELASKVDHREVILPALAASGVDLDAIRRETTFRGRFGPVYAADLPAYFAAGKKKSLPMSRANFGLRHRVDMFLPMNFPIYLIVAVVLAIFFRQTLLGYTLIFWGAVAFLYLFLDFIPGKTGWGQALLSAFLVAVVWAAVDWVRLGNPLSHWGWLIGVFAIFLAAGFDVAGTASPRRSDAELLMLRLGFNRFGSLYTIKEVGTAQLDREKCSGCRTCSGICPVGVFGELDADHKTTLPNRDACFSCGACVKQCPEHALRLAGK